MTDHSNAITDALDDFADAVDVAATDDFYDSLQKQAQINNALNEAKLALYEAVKQSRPEYRDNTIRESLSFVMPPLPETDDFISTGYNQALDDWLTNLSLLFGVDVADSKGLKEASDV